MSLVCRVVTVYLLVYLEVNSSEVPVGHMQPLGSHRPQSTDIIDEVFDWPSPQEFWTTYVRPRRALVLRGAAKSSRAFTQWTDEYLKKNYGDLEVRLEGKKEKSGRIPIGAKGVGRDTIGNFIDNSHSQGVNLSYIVSELPMPMFKDVNVIPPLTCGTFKDHLVEVDLWMSGGGTASILHKDAFNAINCLINGTKDWKMIEYKYENKIYKAWEPPQMVGGYSRINVEKVDIHKYPKVAEVHWSKLRINAGDCLYLPGSYYHQVTSYGSNNIAVALLFSRFDHVEDGKFNFIGCDKALKPTPLSELDIDWKYSGHGNLSMGNTDVGIVQYSMKLFFEGKKKVDRKEMLQLARKKLTKEQLEKKLYYLSSVRDNAELIFDQLGGNKNGYITLEQVENLSRDKMRQLILMMEGTDVTNTVEHEYGYVNAEELINLLEEILQKDGKIEKDRFIQRYQKDFGGTEKVSTEVFDKLRSGDSDTISQDDFKRNIEVALEPYKRWSSGGDDDEEDQKNSRETQDAYRDDDETKNQRVAEQDAKEAKRDEL